MLFTRMFSLPITVTIFSCLCISACDSFTYGGWKKLKPPSIDASNSSTISNDEIVCQPGRNLSRSEVCEYVKQNSEVCESSGYLTWTQYVECAGSDAERIALITTGVVLMLFLFIMVSTVADEFFSPNISAIVAHLKISESVAGVTFMAFGNGCTDIFGSIASLSGDSPKASLALGELMGAGVFVTTMIPTAIILTQPFEVDMFNTIRDLVFYLAAVGWLSFIYLYSDRVLVWEPPVFLGMYAIYIITVVMAVKLYNQKKRSIYSGSRRSSMHSRQSRLKSLIASRRASARSVFTIAGRNSIYDSSQPHELRRSHSIAISRAASNGAGSLSEEIRRSSRPIGIYNPKNGETFSIPSLVPSAILESGTAIADNVLLGADLKKNSFDNLSNYYDDISTDSSDEVIIIHRKVYIGAEAREHRSSTVQIAVPVESTRTFFLDIWSHLRPLANYDDFLDTNLIGKIYAVLQIVPMFLCRLTVPLNESSWSMSIAIIHGILAPQWFLFAFHIYFDQPFGGPALYWYALGLSIILVIFILFFTDLSETPKYYKAFCSYAGFVMSMSWIYFLSTEVVGVVTMIGVISRISHEVLGLTILAWSNSIGDLIADISVARQGFQRMAMAAAIGGPLFNLLMGIGIPFTISAAQGHDIELDKTAVSYVLLTFLAVSLLTTLIATFVQRGFLRRPHAFVLIAVYCVFLTTAMLTATNVIF